MKNIWFRRVVVGPIRTNCYLIGLQDRQDCVVLDPGDSAEKILKAADGRQIAAILFTHGHFDHIAAGKALPGCRVYIHAEDAEMLTSPSKNGSLFLMDEPEAALSPMRLMRLMARMDALVKRASQFIVSTHSPMLMAFPGAEVYEITERGIQAVNCRDTAHWQITRRFLENPEKMLGYLLNE